jgi:hypothetical protein
LGNRERGFNMRVGIILAMSILLANTAVFAAEEKTVTAPFPNNTIDSHATNLFCDAILGTTLQGTSKDYGLVSTGVSKAGIFAKAFQATDRIVIEISEGKL